MTGAFGFAAGLFALALAAASPMAAHAGETPPCAGHDLSLDPAIKPDFARWSDDLLNGDGLLWRIEKPGVAPSYLYGTVHSTQAGPLDLARKAGEFIAGARTVATELGGPTMSQGIHTMDHLLHLLGDWTEVRAVAETLYHQIEVEDVSMALVKFASGARASIVNSTLCPRQETYLRLDCERATVELTHLYAYQRENWKLTPADPAHSDELMTAWNEFPPDVGSTHGAQLNALVDDLESATVPLTSGAEARRTLEFLTALYKSAYTDTTVTRGSIQPGDSFYTALHGGLAPVRHKK